MRIILVAMIACAALSGCSDEGPWGGPAGTKMGLSKDQIQKFAVLELAGENKAGAKMFSSKQAPSMSLEADLYEYVFSDDDRLCMIQLRIDNVGKTHSPLMLELKNKYGLPAKDPGVDWGVVWSSDKYKLNDDLSEISAEFLGTEPNVSAVISYSYTNLKECRPPS